VTDAPFGGSSIRQLTNRAGFAGLGAVAAGPILFLWGLVLHWKRRRLKRDLEARDGSEAGARAAISDRGSEP